MKTQGNKWKKNVSTFLSISQENYVENMLN